MYQIGSNGSSRRRIVHDWANSAGVIVALIACIDRLADVAAISLARLLGW